MTPQTKAHLGMLLWALIVGMSFPVVGLLSPELPPLTLTALRFLVATLAMLPFLRGQGPLLPQARGLILYALMGLCLAAFFAAMFWVAHRTTALTMAVLYVSVPFSAYGAGRCLGVEARDGALLGLLATGALGALLLAGAEGGQERLGGLVFGWNETLYFLGCTASALYPVLSKYGLKKGWLSTSPAIRTSWSLAVGCVLIATLAVALEPVSLMAQASATDLLLIAYLGVFSSGATFWLIQSGTGALTPGVVTAYSYLVPFVSAGLLLANNPRSLGLQWLAGAALVAVAITRLMARDKLGVPDARPVAATSSGQPATRRSDA